MAIESMDNSGMRHSVQEKSTHFRNSDFEQLNSGIK